MIYGITDIGTNTIRAVIYTDEEKIKPIDELVFESEILVNTKDKKLSDYGIERLLLVLNKSVEFFGQNKVDKIYFFATSAMRDVRNFPEINDMTMKSCGISIELLDEEAETLCDFYGVKLLLGENCSGEAIDLGGGSCQILSFENGMMLSGKSLKIGVKRLYKLFGDSTDELEEYVKNEIDKVKIRVCDNLYVMGGTSKNILAALKILHPEIVNSFDAQMLNEIREIDFTKGNFSKIYEKRVNTIEYGVCVISEIIKKCKANRITVINSDARKGYIVLKKGN